MAFLAFVFFVTSILMLTKADQNEDNQKYDGIARSLKVLLQNYYEKQEEKSDIQNIIEKFSEYQNTDHKRNDETNPMIEKKDSDTENRFNREALEQWFSGRFGLTNHKRNNEANPMIEKKDSDTENRFNRETIEQWLSGRFGLTNHKRNDEVNPMIEKKDSEIENRFNREAIEQWLGGRFGRTVYEFLLSETPEKRKK
ncbi:pol-RFamide neuropeptides isoform X10 [Hydra vulgaris]|uniref:Pol-RFamide neuropeptides isoform X10 n=1 Tax=Hydra vulgaris TaxID=6087 RepID=A0ABM4CJV7_HYDVU